MTDIKRFIQSEEFITKSFNEAVQVMKNRFPTVKWEHCGVFMDVAAMHAYLTKDQADAAGLKWGKGHAATQPN